MKLAEIQHSTEFLSRTSLLQILASLIRYLYGKIVAFLFSFSFFLLLCRERSCIFLQQWVDWINFESKSNDDNWKAFVQGGCFYVYR